jgi:hypothetical protein
MSVKTINLVFSSFTLLLSFQLLCMLRCQLSTVQNQVQLLLTVKDLSHLKPDEKQLQLVTYNLQK